MKCIQLFASVFLVVVGLALAQDNTTTTVKPTTTTPKPTTPTTKPTTPTTKITPTTTSPKNTTTAAPATTSTTAKSTSAAPPATTTMPKEPQNTYNVSQDGVQCIEMKAKIDFNIKYDKKKIGNVTQNIAMPGKFEATGTCGNDTQTLSIKFFTNWELEYTFEKEKDSKKYHVSEIKLSYVLDDHFKDPVDLDKPKTVTFNKKSYMSASEEGYICKSKISEESGAVTINTQDLQYKAFNKKSTVTFGGSQQECSADEDTNSIVPIAVGAALAGLVVIVLIAYLIGRKRTRKTGYESV